MFGNSSSPTKDGEAAVDSHTPNAPSPNHVKNYSTIPAGLSLQSEDIMGNDDERQSSLGMSPTGRKSMDEDNQTGEKKRRSSKASSFLASAKNSLHLSGSDSSGSHTKQQPQNSLQKLGKTDPALSVPQGSLNNSAGESSPGPRSTFRVGVTEDKNKKCRRTMEDTHAYLYNFLSTPAPLLNADASTESGAPIEQQGASDSDRSVATSSKVVETDNGYFAIFDGHAGTFAADWCGKKLHILLEENIRKSPNAPVPELLDRTFTDVDQQLEKLPLKNSGCTAVVAVLRWEDRIPNSESATGSTAIAPATAAAVKAASESEPNPPYPLERDSVHSVAVPGQDHASRQRVLYTANVGDARIVLCRNGKALRLSYDHKGSDDNEGKRVANAGGLILNNRVNGVLAVTRALGDTYMKELVTGHPYTTETVIQPDIDEFLILACDGLWDVCSDQEAVDLVRHTANPQQASKQLVDHALSRFSTDNLSCMLVRFDTKAVQNTVDRRNELIGVEGDPLNSKKGGISEADAIVAEARKHVDQSESISPMHVSAQMSQVAEEEEGEPGPELTPQGAKQAKLVTRTV
ncbi:MAG: Protein phosphatase 2C 1 [Candelina submexicana]|nr:MAG: Protein phosphatase 2C 1 [Candelina submexicana]